MSPTVLPPCVLGHLADRLSPTIWHRVSPTVWSPCIGAHLAYLVSPTIWPPCESCPPYHPVTVSLLAILQTVFLLPASLCSWPPCRLCLSYRLPECLFYCLAILCSWQPRRPSLSYRLVTLYSLFHTLSLLPPGHLADHVHHTTWLLRLSWQSCKPCFSYRLPCVPGHLADCVPPTVWPPCLYYSLATMCCWPPCKPCLSYCLTTLCSWPYCRQCLS